MTLVSLPSPFQWPGITVSLAGGPTIAAGPTLDAAGEYIAYVFCAREDMTISHVGFRAGTSTGSPTIEVRIETLDGSGLPSGTLWATNTNGTTGTVSSNTNVLQALTASASITKGQDFCVKIAYASGTSQVIQAFNNISASHNPSLPYIVTNTGTPTKSAFGNNSSLIALGSSSTTFYQVACAFPASAASTGAFNNTNSAKRGLRFTLPFNCRIIGIRWLNNGATGDHNIAIFDDTTGSAVEVGNSSTAFDGDHANGSGPVTEFFDNPVTGVAGTTYRAAIEPTSSTNVNVSTITLPSANYRSSSPAGTTAHYTTFASGSWTDTATDTLPVMDVVIDQVDNGAGTGGGQRVFGG